MDTSFCSFLVCIKIVVLWAHGSVGPYVGWPDFKMAASVFTAISSPGNKCLHLKVHRAAYIESAQSAVV